MERDSGSQQARREAILSKRAKLAELKRQRELRSREFSATRQSIGDASEVSRKPFLHSVHCPYRSTADGSLLSASVTSTKPH